jgi:molybdate transport system ATP-binding protein
VQTGVPFDVVAKPASAQVAQLVGLKNVFRAGVVAHDSTAGETVIEWRRHRLRARLQPAFPAGSQITWSISQGQIALLDGGRDGVNVLAGRVLQCVRLGNNAALTVAVADDARPPLFMTVPLHQARERGIERGSRVNVALRTDSIHLMPPDTRVHEDASKHRRMQPASEVAQ